MNRTYILTYDNPSSQKTLQNIEYKNCVKQTGKFSNQNRWEQAVFEGSIHPVFEKLVKHLPIIYYTN